MQNFGVFEMLNASALNWTANRSVTRSVLNTDISTWKGVQGWLDEEKLPPNRNIELVLETVVPDGEPGPRHEIAYSTW